MTRPPGGEEAADRGVGLYSPRRLAAVRATGLLDTPAELAFDRLAELAARFLEAPLAFVTLVDDRRSFWKAAIGIAATDPAERLNLVEDSFCQYLVATGEPLVVGDTRADPMTRDNPAVEAMGVAAWAGFPLRSANGQVLGSFCVVDTKPREWTARDVEILGALAASASSEIGLRVALAHANDLTAMLQKSLLPPNLPDVAGLDIAARHLPAGGGDVVVGDFYDVFQLPRAGHWAVTIGDVSGKGLGAANVAQLARHTIRAAASSGIAPAPLLGVLNRALLSQQDPADEEPKFLTAIMCTVRMTGQRAALRMSSAGHCPAVMRSADGTVRMLPPGGLPLGLFANAQLTERRLVLHAGDSLVMYTDGISEARSQNVQFGEQGIVDALAAVDLDADAVTIARSLEQAALGHSGEAADDMAVIVIRVPAEPGEARPDANPAE